MLPGVRGSVGVDKWLAQAVLEVQVGATGSCEGHYDIAPTISDE